MSILRNIVRSSVGCIRVTHLGTQSLQLARQPCRLLSAELKERIDGLVQAQKVVVFMKGVPEEPRCGFSNAVVQILRMHGVDEYGSHDILEDEDLRQGIKDYTEWPTIPQVFLDGEFVGGCDIMIQMHQNGELIEELKKIGFRSALLDVPKEDEPSK